MRPPTRSCKLWSQGSFFAVLDTDSDIGTVTQVRVYTTTQRDVLFCRIALAFSLSVARAQKQFGCVTCVFLAAKDFLLANPHVEKSTRQGSEELFLSFDHLDSFSSPSPFFAPPILSYFSS